MKMNRKRWVIVSVAAAMLAVGVLAVGVVAAQNDDDSDSDSFAARVAEILNLDEDTVADAMEQAAREMREDAVKGKLDALVAEGEITQTQADEYMTWIQSAPDGFHGLKGRGFGHHGKRGRHGKGFFH